MPARQVLAVVRLLKPVEPLDLAPWTRVMRVSATEFPRPAVAILGSAATI